MRFYRVSLTEGNDGQRGFQWFTRRADAERRQREWLRDNAADEPTADIAVVDIEPTRDGILAALSRYADHPDNG